LVLASHTSAMPYSVTVDCADATPEAASTASAIKLFFIEKLQKLKNKTLQKLSIFCANIFLPGKGVSGLFQRLGLRCGRQNRCIR
jgi:hypothetical protein